MAYTAWSVVYGEQPTAAKWNQLGENDAGFKNGANIDDDAIQERHIADDAVQSSHIDGDSFYRFRATKTANQTCSAGFQKVTFNSVVRGTFSTAGSRFTAPVAGDYSIHAAVQILQATAGNVDDAVFIYKNGTAFSRGGNVNGTAYPALLIDDVVPMAAGDYLEIWVRIKTAGTQVEGSTQTAVFTGGLTV